MESPLSQEQKAELDLLGLNRSRKSKKIIALAIAGLIVIGGGIGTYEVIKPAKASQSAVRYFTVQRGDVTETITASGTVQAANQVNLNFIGASGKLTAVNVKIGDHVKAGQVLATLDNKNQQLQVKNAESNLASAQARLQQAETGPLGSTIAAQKANLASAQAKLDQLKQGATSDQIALQQANVDKAKVSLQGAQTAYANQQAIANNRTQAYQQVVNAQNQVNQTSIQLQSAKDALTKAQLSATETPSSSEIEDAQTTLEQIQTQITNLRTTIAGVSDPDQKKSLQDQLDAEQSSYDAAQSKLSSLIAQQNSNIDAQNQATVDQAQLSVNQAQANYNAAVQNLQYQQQLYNDQTQTKAQLDQLKNSVDQAQLNYNLAVTQLNQLKEPTDKVTLASAQAAEDQAQAQLDQTMQGTDAATLAQDQAAVDQAQAQLELQQTTFDSYTLKAPIDGVIASVNGKAGESPGSGGGGSSSSGNSGSGGGSGFIVLDDLNASDLQVTASISQSDIGKVQVGQDAEFTTTSFQGKTFTGKVLSIAPEATTSSGVTTYSVLLSASNPDGLLKPGMSTNVSITVGTHSNVLYIPSIALQEINGRDGVMVDSSGSSSKTSETGSTGSQDVGAQSSGNSQWGNNRNQGQSQNQSQSQQSTSNLRFKSVQIGYYSTNKVEITSGLTEGERVAVVMQVSSTSSSANGRSQSGFGAGGFGGGGFGGGGFGGGSNGGGRNGGFGGGGGGNRSGNSGGNSGGRGN